MSDSVDTQLLQILRRQTRKPLQFQAEPDVRNYGAPGHQRKVLKHHGAIRPGPRHHVAVDQDAAAGRRHQAVDHGEERRLAAAGRADDGDELAVHDLQVDAVERCERRPAGARSRAGAGGHLCAIDRQLEGKMREDVAHDTRQAAPLRTRARESRRSAQRCIRIEVLCPWRGRHLGHSAE